MPASPPRRSVALALLLLLGAPTPGATEPAGDDALRIRRVSFTGLATVLEDELRRALPVGLTEGRRTAGVRAALVEAARARVERLLRDRGYLGARVTAREIRPGPEARFVVLELAVTEGGRYRVGALDVSGVGPEDRFAGLRRVVLRSGVLLSETDLARSRDALAGLFADRGHAFVKVTDRLVPHAGEALVDVTFQVVPGPRATIATVTVVGASRTGEQLVRDALLVRPGSAYHRTGLRQAVERLRRSGAFRRVDLVELAQGDRQVRLVVSVMERPLRAAPPR